VLAQILHDWDDERCRAILAQCRRVIPPHGKLLVVELVLPEGGEPFFGKWLDLHMLVMAGGRERTAAEYATLFRGAGFELTRVDTRRPHAGRAERRRGQSDLVSSPAADARSAFAVGEDRVAGGGPGERAGREPGHDARAGARTRFAPAAVRGPRPATLGAVAR
jgi:hypothetical protein